MNAFDAGRAVEARVVSAVVPFIRAVAMDGRYVVTDKGRLARTLQTTVGDLLFQSKRNGDVFGVEIKGETEEKTGNLFLETWSNLSRLKTGWLYTLKSDLLFYHFLDTGALYVASLPVLQDWAFRKGRLYAFPEKCQAKYEQLNDTWGRCVPVVVLNQEAKLRRYSLPDDCGQLAV